MQYRICEAIDLLYKKNNLEGFAKPKNGFGKPCLKRFFQSHLDKGSYFKPPGGSIGYK
jgi:hypothetical protein